ncbi:sialate O-acetylesterase [Flavobacterium sp. N2038]|uniref:sialate O-acetylesterase n=1 Tax=Flavobacterium sp. N2038 TaxID=2986829 RepID=UPI00222479E4|nr:sialate O-acetylesterase [Flavobacterium sp. N2038]
MKSQIIKFIFTLILVISYSCSNDNSQQTNLEEPNIDKPQISVPFIIVVGQSNAEGYAPYSSAPLWLAGNNYELNGYSIWNKDRKIFQEFQLGVNVGSELNSDTRFGFDIFFAKRYIEEFNKPLLCIKQTLGGIPISEKGSGQIARWQASVNLIPKGERVMVLELAQKIKEAQDYAKKNNIKLIPIAILYLQGEADANHSRRLADYKNNFLILKSYLRNLAGNNKLPFINSEIFYRDNKYKKVNSIFKELNLNDPFFKTVNTSGNQTSIGDNLHYDAAAFEFIGNTMFNYYLDLKKINK